MKRKSLKNWFRKGVCTLVSTSIGLMPMYGYANVASTPDSKRINASEIAKQAREFANAEMLNSFGENAKGMATLDGNNLTVRLNKTGDSSFKTMTFDYNELSPKNNLHYSQKDIDATKSYHGDNKAMDKHGGAAKTSLYEDAYGAHPSPEGHAYAIVSEVKSKRSYQMLHTDPLFNKTNEIYGKLEEIAKGLADCTADTKILDNKQVKHVPDYKQCTQVLDLSGTCKVMHNYIGGVIEHYEGPYNVDKCTDEENCTQMWIGNPQDQNFRAGSHTCELYTYDVKVVVQNPQAITNVTIEDIFWDDQMQVFIGKEGEEEKVLQLPYPETFVPKYDKTPNVRPRFTYDGPVSGYPHDSCQQGWSWSWKNAKLDITDIFKARKDGEVVNFKIRVAVEDNGEGFARVKVRYDPKLAITDGPWTTTECMNAAYAIEDGFATGEVRCIKAPNLTSNGCALINGVTICPNNLRPAPIKAIRNGQMMPLNPMCQVAEVTANMNFYKGQLEPWKDIQGNTVTAENVGGNLDECSTLRANPKCSFIKSQCTEGAKGKTGTCYVTDVTYDCGDDVEIADKRAVTKYTCQGDIACMGDECVDTTKEISTSFAKVNALMNSAEYMTQDMACTGLTEDGNFTHEENVSCTVFGGKKGFCLKAVGGWQNCCKSMPGSMGQGQYIRLAMSLYQLHDSTMSLANINVGSGFGSGAMTFVKDMAGSYANFATSTGSAISNGASSLASGFSTTVSNMGAKVADMFKSIIDWKDKVIEGIKKKISEMIQKLFQKLGISSSQATGSTAGAAAIQKGVSTVFAVVGWVYAAYQVAHLAVQMIYKCTEEQMMTVSKRDQGNCKFVGSYCKSKVLGACMEKRDVYCCYNSALARIMNEQIRKQGDVLGEDFDGFGSAENPKCDGVPLEKFDQIDWSRVDLDEWTAILTKNNLMKNADNISLDKLTGKGSGADVQPENFERQNTLERSKEKFKNIDWDMIRIKSAEHMIPDVGNIRDTTPTPQPQPAPQP